MDGVKFVQGEECLAYYKVPDAKYFMQVFCKTCGSKMPRLDPDRGIAVIPFGGLDDDPEAKPDQAYLRRRHGEVVRNHRRFAGVQRRANKLIRVKYVSSSCMSVMGRKSPLVNGF